ncbi:MAG: TolC family protein [Verrucomicrobia bacterium]|nr:TolC family protein [Verrucomicrobiota bacterium]
MNLARLRQARSALEGSEWALRTSILDVLRATELAYWGVAFAHAERRFRQSSLQVAERLLEEASEREAVGVATTLDVLQARAALAQRKDEIVRSQQSLEEAADALRVLLADLPEISPLPDVPNVTPLPQSFTPVPEFRGILQQALRTSPLTARQETLIEQRRQERVLARDQVRPQLDLALTGGYLGRDRDSYTDAMGSALDRDGTQWEVRLELNLPWGFRSQRAQVRQSERRLEQEELRLVRLEQDLLEQVRRQWRRLSSSHERLETANVVLELQQLAFEQETLRYEAGLTTFRAVLEAQRDLDNAQISQLNAILELLSAEVDLLYLNGGLLPRHGFTWDTLPHEADTSR